MADIKHLDKEGLSKVWGKAKAAFSDKVETQNALNKKFELPSGGTVGQVLTKTESGTQWSDVSGASYEIADKDELVKYLKGESSSLTGSELVDVSGIEAAIAFNNSQEYIGNYLYLGSSSFNIGEKSITEKRTHTYGPYTLKPSQTDINGEGLNYSKTTGALQIKVPCTLHIDLPKSATYVVKATNIQVNGGYISKVYVSGRIVIKDADAGTELKSISLPTVSYAGSITETIPHSFTLTNSTTSFDIDIPKANAKITVSLYATVRVDNVAISGYASTDISLTGSLSSIKFEIK